MWIFLDINWNLKLNGWIKNKYIEHFLSIILQWVLLQCVNSFKGLYRNGWLDLTSNIYLKYCGILTQNYCWMLYALYMSYKLIKLPTLKGAKWEAKNHRKLYHESIILNQFPSIKIRRTHMLLKWDKLLLSAALGILIYGLYADMF